MRVSHSFPAIAAVFDDPNLVSCAGLAPTLALAQRAGLADLVADTLTLKAKGGVNAHLKIPALVAGMVAGADSIEHMDLLRHGGMDRLFTGVRAPSTLGTFLRTFTFGHVRQLDAVAAKFLTALAKNAPILPGADQVCYVDIDDTIKATYGYAKEGTGFGYTGVKGLNALLAIVSTPLSAPVIAASRLRKGGTNSARGAARFVADALVTAKACGAGGLVILRADSAYYGHKVVAAARRGGARFSITVRMDSAVTKAISGIAESAWTPIKYPNAIWDEDEERFISDAEVPEVSFTALTSRRKSEHVHGRLIVRRVKRLWRGPRRS
jgi:Transposase DDE domain group 1